MKVPRGYCLSKNDRSRVVEALIDFDLEEISKQTGIQPGDEDSILDYLIKSGLCRGREESKHFSIVSNGLDITDQFLSENPHLAGAIASFESDLEKLNIVLGEEDL